MRGKWRDQPRSHRWTIVGAFFGMGVGAWAVFEYAVHGTTFDRWLIMSAGLLGGGAVGALLARLTAR